MSVVFNDRQMSTAHMMQETRRCRRQTFKEVSETSCMELTAVAESTGMWINVPVQEGIADGKLKVEYRSYNEDSGILADATCIRSTIDVEVPPEFAFTYMSDLSKHKNWDAKIKLIKLVTHFDEENGIIHAVLDATPHVPRDFCLLWTRKKLPDGRCILSTRSVKHKSIPEIEGYIRAQSLASGHIISPSRSGPTECCITHVQLMDDEGSLVNIDDMLGTDHRLSQSMTCLKNMLEGSFKNSKQE